MRVDILTSLWTSLLYYYPLSLDVEAAVTAGLGAAVTFSRA